MPNANVDGALTVLPAFRRSLTLPVHSRTPAHPELLHGQLKGFWSISFDDGRVNSRFVEDDGLQHQLG